MKHMSMGGSVPIRRPTTSPLTLFFQYFRVTAFGFTERSSRRRTATIATQTMKPTATTSKTIRSYLGDLEVKCFPQLRSFGESGSFAPYARAGARHLNYYNGTRRHPRRCVLPAPRPKCQGRTLTD